LELSKIKADRVRKIFEIIFLNKTGFVGFVFYNVIGELAEGR